MVKIRVKGRKPFVHYGYYRVSTEGGSIVALLASKYQTRIKET